MCRHLVYLGAPDSPAELLLRAPHSLLRQSHAPHDMRCGGTVNVDGFGLGWYTSEGTPVRYRRTGPLWADESVPGLADSVRTTAFLAAVRSGTPGMPVSEATCAPFRSDRWLFSHNGVVTGWPDSVAGLAEKLPVTDLLRLEAPTDSALLWALLRDRLRGGQEPLAAVTGLVAEVARAAPGSRLNLLLTDGERAVATAWTHALSVRHTPDGVVVASEPCDGEPGWTAVPEGRALLVRRRGGIVTVETHPIDPADAEGSTAPS
ncbi:glutamine amidotransferase [Amycolatopsis arida]|uniref:Gamma-glutamyl-hercynylcysteine sulfoxide hydrolase n=1 Tax=Amycolatopsis arida TaxID=587909 RepID=A0A1I5ZP31_9PSEU|nr:ergothioneine biosynthesis protein EgtC [Amycolatopsis arida]TDX89241.1 glutamine amidotransferase [Amycolatopsis arida]SFQ58150.1 glutamine amidotransferase [Amycolatopsis arida]